MSRRSRFFAPMMALALASTVWVAAPVTAAAAAETAIVATTEVSSVSATSVASAATSGRVSASRAASTPTGATSHAPAPQSVVVTEESGELANAQSERTNRIIILSLIGVVLIAILVWLVRGIIRDQRKKHQR